MVTTAEVMEVMEVMEVAAVGAVAAVEVTTAGAQTIHAIRQTLASKTGSAIQPLTLILVPATLLRQRPVRMVIPVPQKFGSVVSRLVTSALE